MLNGNVIDYNYRYGVIGIYKAPRLLTQAKAYIAGDSSNKAGELSSYIFEFSVLEDVIKNVVFRIIFP